jgi:hypothetical protein
MALPGIAKVRAEAREADNLLLVERQRLTDRIHAIAGKTSKDGLLINAAQASALAEDTVLLLALQKKVNELWDRVAEMEDT